MSIKVDYGGLKPYELPEFVVSQSTSLNRHQNMLLTLPVTHDNLQKVTEGCLLVSQRGNVAEWLQQIVRDSDSFFGTCYLANELGCQQLSNILGGPGSPISSDPSWSPSKDVGFFNQCV